jgi:hypothetical protein
LGNTKGYKLYISSMQLASASRKSFMYKNIVRRINAKIKI